MAKVKRIQPGPGVPISAAGANKFISQEGELILIKSAKNRPALARPNCHVRDCIHLWGLVEGDGDPYVACEAFPKGIPDEIAYGQNLHLEPVKGDHGIVFKEKLKPKQVTLGKPGPGNPQENDDAS